MTVESELKRIADALELRNKLTVAPPTDYVAQRKAEIVAEVGPQKTGAKGSAIKPKKEEPVKEEVPEADPFEADEPEKEVTLEEVRDALIKFRGAKQKELGDVKGKEAALTLMSKFGDGAQTLASPQAGREVGMAGVLKPEFYAAVLKAATL